MKQQSIEQLARDPETRRMAIIGARAILKRLETEEQLVDIAELRTSLEKEGGAAPKKRLSAAGRARIIAAAKARWARVREAKAADVAAQNAAMLLPAITKVRRRQPLKRKVSGRRPIKGGK